MWLVFPWITFQIVIYHRTINVCLHLRYKIESSTTGFDTFSILWWLKLDLTLNVCYLHSLCLWLRRGGYIGFRKSGPQISKTQLLIVSYGICECFCMVHDFTHVIWKQLVCHQTWTWIDTNELLIQYEISTPLNISHEVSIPFSYLCATV